MADLTNPWPNWGETGELPPDGFFYEGGDQVNQKHLDAIWNNTDTQTQELIDGITKRVVDLLNNVVLDGGLSASEGSGTREVDVTASSDGAYINGQYSGSTTATTLTLSANGGSTVRTDAIWVDTNGGVGKSEGTTTVSSSRMEIAEVDVDPSDVINEVRNVGRRLSQIYRSADQPSDTNIGDLWTDLSNNRAKVYQGGAFRKLLTDQDSATVSSGDGLSGGGSFSLDGGSTSLAVSVSDIAGTHLSDDGSNNLTVNDDFVENTGDVMSGALDMGNNALSNVSTLTANDHIENATYPNKGSLPIAPEGAMAFVGDDSTIYVQVD